MQGKLIAIYGINNIGKSTQTSLLVQRLHRASVRVEYVKYPIYDLDPTGKKLNEILRGKKKSVVQSMIEFFPHTKVRRPGIRTKNNLFRSQPITQKDIRQRVTEEELQMWYSLNRYQYNPIVRRKLESGITIIAEDYTGTGIAWGTAKGADITWLESVNKYLRKPDLEILLDGERFHTGREKVHLHESSDRLIRKAQTQFRLLADKYEWQRTNANQPIQKVADDLWALISPLFPHRDHTADSWITAPLQQKPAKNTLP